VFEATRSPIAEAALTRLGELYAIEREVNGRPADRLRRTRIAIRRCSRHPDGRSWSGSDSKSGECRF
jgi:hypothetical protein